tara:strand:+ start:48 stop:743 length:696 start_codon:yes stop_codon:yes gene_type:complete
MGVAKTAVALICLLIPRQVGSIAVGANDEQAARDDWRWTQLRKVVTPTTWPEKAASCGVIAGAVICLREGLGAGGGYLTAGGAMLFACRHHQENANLKRISKDFERQLTKLHETIGAVGDQRGGMLDRLEGLWNQQKIETDRQRTENDRHAALLDWQSRLELLRMFQLFDEDRDVALSEAERQRAAKYLRGIRNAFPRGDLRDLLEPTVNTIGTRTGIIRLEEIERQLMPP